MVISGEVPLALTVYNYMPEQAKKKGAPIDWFALEPAIARSNAVGVARRAPHPNAALLFYEYMLGEAQQYFVGHGLRAHQHEGRLAAQGREDPADGSDPLARRSGQVDQAVRGHDHQACATMSAPSVGRAFRPAAVIYSHARLSTVFS